MSFKILKEPLFHFLLLGAVIFVVYFMLNPAADNAGNQIRVTQGDVERFKQVFQKQWQRQPTTEELQGLIRAHLKEEVLYREALAMGLEKDDTIVRRRLAQKVEFLITDITVPTDVDDKELMTFYEKNATRYTRATRLSFRHIYFNPDIRGERTMDEANATLHTLQSTNAGMNVPDNYGDRYMLPLQFESAAEDEVARAFGRDFAEQLVQLEPGRWQGPVRSGYGVHLVYIKQRVASSVYPFNEVRERVKNDYLFDLRQTRNEEVLEKLKARYKIIVEGNLE
jgi:peptidyl-prolyl cis-trans isomerase C